MIYLCSVKIKLLTNQTPTAMTTTTNNNEMRNEFINAMNSVKTSNELPAMKSYRLMYFFGVWTTKAIFHAENDTEAIHDCDEIYNDACQLKNWQYPVALFCGNRKVKSYK